VRGAEDGTIHTDSAEAARLIEVLGLDSDTSRTAFLATDFKDVWLGLPSSFALPDGVEGLAVRRDAVSRDTVG
jgi:hypothetical protein